MSVETVYKTYGGKSGLVRAICAKGLGGDGTVHAEIRSNALREEPDPRAIIEGWGRLTAEVAPRVAPILLLVRAAATSDPEMAALRSELETSRLTRMTDNARALAAAGHLRAGLTVRHAAEVLWTYSSPELYELLVLIRRWPLRRYGAFVADAMIAALLPRPEVPADRVASPR